MGGRPTAGVQGLGSLDGFMADVAEGSWFGGRVRYDETGTGMYKVG